MSTLETITDPSGWYVKISQDEDASYCDPRDNDNLGTLLCWHRRYKLGDANPYNNVDHYEGWDALRAAIEDDGDALAFISPVYLYDHGQIQLSLGDPGDRWDSGQVGFYFVTIEQARTEYGDAWRDKLEDMLRIAKAELDEYTKWCNGDVYGYQVCNPQGAETDSCWGHIGWDYAKEAAQEALTSSIAYYQEQERQVAQLLNTGFAL